MAKEISTRGESGVFGPFRLGKKLTKLAKTEVEIVKSSQVDKAKEISTHGVIRGLSAFRMVKSPAKAGSVKSRQVYNAVKKVAWLRGASKTKYRSTPSYKTRISREE